jgi:hypothetical protein
MAIDFNREPYFDDYDPSKEYYKILFRPGFAVQARELTQIQTAIQKQIERFGDHVFREGSIVLGGDFDYQRKTPFVRLSGINVSQDNVDRFIGETIVGLDSDLSAYVVTGTIDEDDDTIILYVRYLNSNDIDETAFRQGETITIDTLGFEASVEDDSEATGFGTIFTIAEGVVYSRGYFVSFPRSTIVVDKYGIDPTKTIGFRVEPPRVATSADDPSLLDNARGSSNFAAPGANRLVLSLTLDALEPEVADTDDNFTAFVQVKEGEESESQERTQYSRIYEEIAKRTSDESGDYYVRGLTVRTREALDTGSNEGLDPNGDEDKLSIDIEPGLAYVQGYEVNNQSTHHELIDKSIDFEFVDNAIVSARTGGYIVVNEVVGAFNVDEGTIVNLYDTAEQRVTNETNASFSPAGSIIGTARVKTVLNDEGELGTPNGTIRLYLFDVEMTGSNVPSDAAAVQTTGFFADISQDLTERIENTLIYRIGQESVRKLRSNTQLENNTDTSYSFYTTSSSTIEPNTKSVTVTSNESLSYSVGLLSDIERSGIFLSVDSALGSPNNFYEGQHLDLSDPSVTINVISSTTFTISLGNTFDAVSTSVPVTVSYKARRPDIFESTKILTPKVYVKIGMDQSGAPDVSQGIPLGFADVHQIRSIRIAPSDSGSDPFTSVTDGTDVTNSFVLDNGQKDNFYDHARIRPVGLTLDSDSWLLIELDYFKSTTHSYFSVDSYPIDDTAENDDTIFTFQIPKYTTSSGETYNLRNSLDYRPVKESTATETQNFSNASVNPEYGDTFIGNETTGKLLIPFPSSRIRFDYSYYLARRDVLTLDYEGNFSTVRGKPSLSPVTPPVPENVMGIANIFIPPFPSISQTFSRILGLRDNFCTHERITHKRFTMRDINVLQQRVENLEYYNALNLIEKETADLRILDENGNDRFKNGFFVDGFLDHSLGDTTNPEYNIAVDREEQAMRPVFESDSFKFFHDAETDNLDRIGNLVHLPVLSEKSLIEQNSATTRRNVEQSVYRFIGNMELDPDNDTWIDETTVDKNLEIGDDLPTERTISTNWQSWERNGVGANLYARPYGDRSGNLSVADFVGSFSSYNEALAASTNAGRRGANRTLIENVNQETRKGIRTQINFEKETQQFGNFITDVSVIPYIRPQAINFYVSGIKPRTRHFFFFDGEDVTQYVRQYSDVDQAENFIPEGSELRSDNTGQMRGVLFLPSSGKRFRVGTKELVVSDSNTDFREDVTSRAKSLFIASGLNVQRQNTTLSTKLPTSISEETLTETRNVGDRPLGVEVIGPSCIAYTFKVEVPKEEEGTFVTSVDLFFEEFHPDLGFRVQLRELNSGGNITQNVIPYSEVWTDRKILDSQGNKIDNPILQTSDDATAPTNIKFKAPVFLYNDTSYAIVVSAENINPDTYLWISRLGETDVSTQEPVTSRRLTGAVYTTNNSVNWDIVPQTDLKFKLYRAQFDTNQEVSGSLTNDSFEFFNLTSVESSFNTAGETITGSDRIVVSVSSGTVSTGQTVEGTTSNGSGTVVDVDGQVVLTTAFGLQNGETVEFSSGGSVVATGTVTSVSRGSATLRKYKVDQDRIVLEKSNGRFFEGARIVGETSEIEAVIDSFSSFPYTAIHIKPDFLDFQNTSVDFERRGRLSSDNSLTEFINANEDSTTELKNENVILSRSQEIDLFGENGFSTELKTSMSTDSEYISPMVDMSRAHSVYIHNTINSDTSDEENPEDSGSLINKYVSKGITLADGQDAEDLKVLLTIYRPPSQGPVENDIVVWMRVRNTEDPEELSDRPWMQMVVDQEVFSSVDDTTDFIEVEYNVDPEYQDNAGVVSYDTTIGSDTFTFTTFKQYQIKVGLVGSNAGIVPRIADLRAIALQK